MAKIEFFGAAGEVTGSCYHLVTPGGRVLIDFGLFQGLGSRKKNEKLPGIKAQELDAVVLTHAHLDHSGRLPVLCKAGYGGPIYATQRTIELAKIILEDSAQIQEGDAAEQNKRLMRAGKAPVSPLYTREEARRTFGLFAELGYEQPREIVPGVSVRLVDAGHILGSSSVEVTLHKPARPMEVSSTIIFSADIGPKGSPILRDARTFNHADVVVLESTYGDRDHRSHEETIEELARVITDAMKARAKVLIPAFAVGRTQDLIYHIGQMVREKRIEAPVCYVDSPMALAATELYAKATELHDAQAKSMRQNGTNPLSFHGLTYVRTAAQSRRINDVESCMVIAGSGMCTGGRILHHFKHELWKPRTHVVFVGYQAQGTLGREIIDGAKTVHVMGQPIAVKAKVHTIGGFSAHAGQSELLEWLGGMMKSRTGKKPRVVLTHGEDMPRRMLARQIKERFGVKALMPKLGDVLEV